MFGKDHDVESKERMDCSESMSFVFVRDTNTTLIINLWLPGRKSFIIRSLLILLGISLFIIYCRVPK